MQHLLIGTYTTGESLGIYGATFDKGHLSLSGAFPCENPSWITISGNMGYAVEEGDAGRVLAFLLHDNMPTAPVETKPLGSAPCHITVDDKSLYVANYGAGTLAVIPLHADGTICGEPTIFRHTGRSVTPRQEAPHVHQSFLTAEGKHLAVCDLGTDEIVFYPRQDGSIQGQGTPMAVPPGTGPRHGLCGRGDIWYVIGELSSQVLVYTGYGPDGRLLQRISALPEDKTLQENYAAALRLSPDGNFLMASVRGADILALFPLLGDGRLGIPKLFDCHGRWPRDAVFSPDGSHVLCACEHSSKITLFAHKEGNLTYAGCLAMPSPSCICFIP